MTDSTTPDATATSDAPIRVAVIVAHPDDAEFGSAGTVARWAAEGRHITYVLLTSGDKGSADPAVTPEMLVATREAEQRAACAVLGVKNVVFLRRSDATLVPDLDLRRDLTRVIRQLKPDVVICQDPTVQFVGTGYLNHPDHRAAGQATLDAIYPSARDRMTFPELLAEGLEPHKVREIYVGGTDAANIWIDTTAYHDVKVAALKAHASQVGDWDFAPMIREWSARTAQEHPGHGELAEGYRYLKLD